MAAVQQQHWWYAARRDIVAAAIRRLHLPAHASVLEIGCGTGANLQMLSQHGRLSAMEYDPTARQLADALGICPVQAGGLPDDLPYAAQSFDLVCMLDVLEHIEDDQAALASVLRLLKPGGRLLLTVPAYQWLWSGHDTDHAHFRRYTVGGLRRVARRAGWVVDRAAYFNTLLFPAVAAVRLADKLLRRPHGTGTQLPPPRVNTLLTKLLRSERHVVAGFGGFPVGVSAMALLRRPG